MQGIHPLVVLSENRKKIFSFIDFFTYVSQNLPFQEQHLKINIPQTRANCTKAIASQKRIKFEHVQKLYKRRDEWEMFFNKKNALKGIPILAWLYLKRD